MFRCDDCLEAKIFMNVPIRAVPKPTPDDISKEKIYYPLDYSATLASLVVGIGTEKLNTLYGLLDIPPSPTAYHRYKILKRETAEVVARKCMDDAKEELTIKFGVDAITQCVHFPVSFDGAYSKAADPSIWK